jgi:raffinose/stachyose/melibiose transport system substrate-binding protein
LVQPVKTSRRTILFAVIAAVVVLVAVGAVLLTSVQRPAEKIKIEWWDEWGEARLKWAEEMKAAFEKQHPEVEIVIVEFSSDEEFKTKFEASIAAGQPPAVFRTLGGGVLKSYVDGGHVEDLTDLLNEDWAVKQIPRAMLRQSTWGGRHYAVPFDLWVGHFYINRELFQKAGVEIPPITKAWTWDEFKEAIKKFKAAGIIPIAVGGKDKWELSFYYMYLVDRLAGSDAFRKTINRAPGYSFTDEHWIKAGYLFKELVDLGAFQEGFIGASYDEAQNLFFTGKAAMWLQGPWILGDLFASFPDFPIDIINFPTVPGGKGDPTMLLGAVQHHYAIAKNIPASVKKYAYEFLRFITREESMVRYAELSKAPLAQNVKVPTEQYPEVLMKIIESASRASWLQMAYDEYSPPKFAQVHLDSLAAVAAGTMTPEQMAEAQEAAARELHQQGVLPIEQV